jgi:dCMP deaminase
MSSSYDNRLSWSEYALSLAEAASLRSEDPYVKVGACALDKHHRVLGVGYNGVASGKDTSYGFWQHRDGRRPFMIHAETNCLSLFRRGECQILAVTLLPCSSCATMIAAYGIEQVIYKDEYDRDDGAKKIFDFYDVTYRKIEKK